ncbi:MAG: DUF2520 domain-containing protein [Chitinophagaceae bacterium]|nr:DUF2520 domain-containing protein [Chitinophagaceae bacterium]
MEIVIFGSGNVASVLGRKFKAAGHNILQIVARNASAASSLAYELNTESTNYLSLVHKTADIYILAVPDSVIIGIAKELRLPDRVVAHTAASVSKDVLNPVTSRYGVFYPLQSLRKEMSTLPTIPLFFDGSDQYTSDVLQSLADSISPQLVTAATDEQRLKLHVAAVITGNFTNHLYSLAEEYCRKEGIDFAQLRPLIAETALRIQSISPKQAQTGPAIRHDRETIEKHLALLENHPSLKSIYVLMTESIQSDGGGRE